MTARYLIRRIRKTDDAAVATLIRTVMPEFGAKGPGFAILDPEVDAMYESYDDPRSVFYVIVDRLHDDAVVGAGGVAQLVGGDDATCELRKMYFYPEVRGNGLGRELLARCLDAARARGYTRCYLETLANMTAAGRLYASAGFRPRDTPLGSTGHFGCDRYYELDLVSSQTPAGPLEAVPEQGMGPTPAFTHEASVPPPEARSVERPGRRWAARFDDANDHNPLVLEDCADCLGRGTICVELDGVAELGTCPACSGTGTTGRACPYFPNAAPLAAPCEATQGADGTATCPACGERFRLDSTRAWTGRRHVACGAPLTWR